MQTQKSRLFVFCTSLIPGAGEMYLGKSKRGVSMMLLFFGIIILSFVLSAEALLMMLPIPWFYSFFYVHNLNRMPREEFLRVEDKSIFPFVVEEGEAFWQGYANVLAILIVLVGAMGIWNILIDILGYFTPDGYSHLLWTISRVVPQALFSIVLIYFGIRMYRNSPMVRDEMEEKEEFDMDFDTAADMDMHIHADGDKEQPLEGTVE